MFEEKGAYHEMDRKLYNANYSRHKMVPSQKALDALHVIQEVPWTINEDVMKFVDYVGKNECALSYIHKKAPTVRLTQTEWENLSKADKRDIYANKEKEVSATGKSRAIKQRITIANDLRGLGDFYQPQFLDFRGRVYPMNTEFNNQADHWAKGMMMFSNGMRLGVSGIRQLKLHIANTAGQDKLQLEDREAWVDNNIDDIRRVATSMPFAAEYCANNTDEPLAFYAAAIDLVNAIDGDGDDHVSHIPCAVDGTCNGLQILSLLGHDSIGADKTNCTSNPIRQDVYMEVADIALDLVKADLDSTDSIETVDVEGNQVDMPLRDVAAIWHSHLTDKNKRRKAVKRAIMTTAYGVSEFSIGNNLIADGIVDKLVLPAELLDLYSEKKLKSTFAAYFRNKIVVARAGAISQAVQIMDYFTATARTLGEHGRDFTWTTPDGLKVTQGYRHMDKQRFNSAELGHLVLKKVTNNVDARKQGTGAAPQVVHSLDAAMLRMTALRMSENGYGDLCMIHDSYGAHAGAIDVLHTTLREVAVELFGGNWLADSFHVEQLSNGVDLMSPPAQGDLDVNAEIPNATYFFS